MYAKRFQSFYQINKFRDADRIPKKILVWGTGKTGTIEGQAINGHCGQLYYIHPD